MGPYLHPGRGRRDLLAHPGKFREVLIEAAGQIERRAVVGGFVGPQAAGVQESRRHAGTGFGPDAKDGEFAPISFSQPLSAALSMARV